MADPDYSTEEWRTIAAYPDYAVSNFGRVMRVVDAPPSYAGRILKTWTQHGYVIVGLLNSARKQRFVKVHRLVCEAWHGAPPTKRHQAAHWDGNKSNNTPNNLRWATAKENAGDNIRLGRTATGERNAMRLYPERRVTGDAHWCRKNPERMQGTKNAAAKLTEEQVKAILAEPQYHGVGRALERRFGVSISMISAIRRGRAWRYLPRP